MQQMSPPTGPGLQHPGAPKKKVNWALYVGGGCLVLLVICCVVPVGGFFGMLSSKATETAERFIDAGHRRDTATMQGMLRGYYSYDITPDAIAAGLPRCPGITSYTSYELEVRMLDHPFDDFVSVAVTYQTPNGPIEASIGIDDGDHVSLYSEHGANLSFGDCDLSAWRATPRY
jgi:hypothetical protein